MSWSIQIEKLGKKYRRGEVHPLSINFRESLTHFAKSALSRLNPFFSLQPSLSPKSGEAFSLQTDSSEFWAIKDIDLEVQEGEIFGIIGRNGAGKSTLLKILSRIVLPTCGLVRFRGRMAALLEVGTGFHRELTGRENIYLNGSILGMRRAEITRQFDEIVEFAGVSDFIDTPVKFYSSGMYMRLAFAVSAHLQSDILIVDEVLAVGDAAFQKKCLGKMEDVAKQGKTVFFVSHNMGAVAGLCSSAIWLQDGRIRARGQPAEIIKQYLSRDDVSRANIRFFDQPVKGGQFRSIRLLNDKGEETVDFHCGSDPVVEIGYDIRRAIAGLHVAVAVSTLEGQHLFSTADTDLTPDLYSERKPGCYLVRLRLPMRHFNVGGYIIRIAMGVPGVEVLDEQDGISLNILDAGGFGSMKEGGRRAGLLLAEIPWENLNPKA